MVKMFHARRSPDAAQKKQIPESSSVVAEVMLKHINLEPTSGKFPYTLLVWRGAHYARYFAFVYIFQCHAQFIHCTFD